MKIFFSINKGGIRLFSSFFVKGKSVLVLYQDAKKQKKYIKTVWEDLEEDVFILFGKLFPVSVVKTKEIVRIEIYPSYYRLGAVNVRFKKILLGQPERNKVFYVALIAHELTHLYLQDTQYDLVNEALAMQIESEIYSSIRLKIKDVWKKSELDAFHKAALTLCIKTIASFWKVLQSQIPLSTHLETMRTYLKHNGFSTRSIKPKLGLINNLDRLCL